MSPSRDDAETRAAIAARRKPGAVLQRLGGGLTRLANLVTGGGVPEKVRQVLEASFAKEHYSRTSVIAQERVELGDAVVNFDDARWDALARTLLPQYAEAACAALRSLRHRPLQVGRTRKPFRSHRSTLELARVRIDWLLSVTVHAGEYDADIEWLAAHAVDVAGWGGVTDLGWLFAGAIDAGGKTGAAVRETLMASARGDHPTGKMGRHVTQALMSSSDPVCWEFNEKLLLAAQREEGLRQVILESVDESHPEAFKRMLRMIVEHDLARFSSVVRAVDVWFGFLWDGASTMKTADLVATALAFLEDEKARNAAIDGADAERAYLGLWVTAFTDLDLAVAYATALRASASPELRFVATHLLAQSFWTSAITPLVAAVADEDLRVAARAADFFQWIDPAPAETDQLFTHLEGLMARLSKRAQSLPPIVWPWNARKLDRPWVAQLMAKQSEDASGIDAERLLPYVPDLEPFARARFIRRAASLSSRYDTEVQKAPRPLSPKVRPLALELLGDGSADVRESAFDALAVGSLQQDEVERIITLLDRKSGDLRTRAIQRLRALDDRALLATADRLLADASEARQRAGLEVLRDAAERGRARAEVETRLARYAGEGRELGVESRAHVAAVLGGETTPATREDALGLIDPSKRKRWPKPRARTLEYETAGAKATLEALAALVLEHQAVEVRAASGEIRLLAEAGFGMGPVPQRGVLEPRTDGPPLADLWRGFFAGRGKSLRDPDGLELVRLAAVSRDSAMWNSAVVSKARGLGEYSSGVHTLNVLIDWGIAWEAPAGGLEFSLDALETALAAFDDADVAEIQRLGSASFREHFGRREAPAWAAKANKAEREWRRVDWWQRLFPGGATPVQVERFYGMLRAHAMRLKVWSFVQPWFPDYLAAHAIGIVDEDELIDLLVGPNADAGHHSMLRDATSRKKLASLADRPALVAAIDRVRRRIVEIEVQRGDRETAASRFAIDLRTTGGLETVLRAMAALGAGHFIRTASWSSSTVSRQQSLSHLVLRSLPAPDETPEAFARAAAEAKLKPAKLIELALYAPQWAAHVEHAIKWPGLAEAVWWVEAHTKDDRSWQLGDMKELWTAAVSERTPLTAIDLTEGGVDVEWFRRVHAALGAERWAQLDKAAKYAASAGGHTRAQLFAAAMAGAVTRAELEERMRKSRHQDSVRALGLLPLADGEAGKKDLLERYRLLDRFRRESRKFGSQKQASEGRAVAIGTENLARTAGFRDPQRLTWAMERAAVADLAKGPVTLDKGDVRFTLAVDEDGVPSIAVTKGGKPQKAVPAALKKDPEVAELQARLAELKRQRSRVRDALETAMIRGDRFEGPELRDLLTHPILAPSLSRLVFIGDGVAGYPAEGGRALRRHDGRLDAVGDKEELRLAHPDDLRALGDWSAWQRECLSAERMQPFKQVFRELYPRMAQEDGDRSRRYAGHQVQPRQALALLGGRGWVARPEEGVSRTFHEAGLTVWLGFQEAFFTPAEVEGLTLEEVVFTRKGASEALPLESIPPRLFSEVMRDLDLVVSVAHRGGVDPEASASTVEMRATLVRESCALLKLTNVELRERHVIIRGSLAEYAVHLGSAGVTVLPGTAIPIVAVHSQHRGRLFLPFADDDPRSAEVMSKVLMLARDERIKDPTVLEWIQAAVRGHA